MKKYGWIIVLLFSGLILGPKLKQLEGFVVIAIDKTTAQFPLWLGILILFLTVIVVHIMIEFFKKTSDVVSQVKEWSGSHKWKKARRDTIAGMMAFAEGRWEISEKNMLKAAKEGDTKLINYLIAAEAAQNRGDFEKRSAYLQKCKQVAPDKDFAIELTQARLQLESSQYEEAQASLRHLLEMEPANDYVLRLYARTSDKLNDWDEVINSFNKGHKNDKEMEKFFVNAIKNKLTVLSFDQKKKEIAQLWKNLPNKIKKQTDVIYSYIKVLIDLNEKEKAEKLLRKQLKNSDDFTLIKLFSTIESSQPGKQLDIIENKIPNSRNKAEVLDILVNLSIKLKLWTKAKRFIEQSIKIKNTSTKQLKLAKILNQLGNKDQAVKIWDQLLEI